MKKLNLIVNLFNFEFFISYVRFTVSLAIEIKSSEILIRIDWSEIIHLRSYELCVCIFRIDYK